MNFEHLNPTLRFLNILFHWRRFIIITAITCTILTIGLSYLIVDQYKSTATIMIPDSNIGGGFGALSSIVSSSLPSIGSKLLGGNANTDKIIGIIESRLLQEKLINEFKLDDYYGKNGNSDLILKEFRKYFLVDINPNMMIDISFTNENSILSSEVVNRSIEIADSLNRRFTVEEAKENEIFIGNRYRKNVLDLKNAEDSLNIFQKKYGVLLVDEQLKVVYKTIGEFEAEIIKSQIEMNLIEKTIGKESSQYERQELINNSFKNELVKIKNKENTTDNSFLPLDIAPDLLRKYLRYVREVEIQSKILEYTLPMYEQWVMETKKNIPSIIVLDRAKPSTYKDYPKRLLILILVIFPVTIILIIVTFIFYFSENNPENPVNKSIIKISSKIRRIYRIQV